MSKVTNTKQVVNQRYPPQTPIKQLSFQVPKPQFNTTFVPTKPISNPFQQKMGVTIPQPCYRVPILPNYQYPYYQGSSLPVKQSSDPQPPLIAAQSSPSCLGGIWKTLFMKKASDTMFLQDDPIVVPPRLQKQKQKASYNLEEKLKLTIKAQKKIIQLNSQQQEFVPFLVNIKTQDFTKEQQRERAPIDLICVIDISISMAGEKIDLVRSTLKNLLEFTNQYDRISLIQFDDKADQLTPLLRNTPQNLKLFEAKINSLKDRGGTDINAGMNLAFNVIKQRESANPVTSIFLLTDGLDKRAQKRVQATLAGYGLHNQSFTITCFGFGNHHDEDMLVKIAKLRDGSFYYIEKLDIVDEAFADALGGLMSVVANDVSIHVKSVAVRPFDGIKITNTFGDKWQKQSANGSYEIKLRQLMAGVEKGFMAELLIPALNLKVADKQRNLAVVEVTLVTKDTTGKNQIVKNATLILHLVNQNQLLGQIQEDSQVLENYFRVKGALTIEDAMKDANMGKFQLAKAKLQNILKQITQNKNVNQRKMLPLLSQLEQSLQSCQSQLYDYGGKKAMMSQGYAMMEQKPAADRMCQNMVQATMVNQVRAQKMQG